MMRQHVLMRGSSAALGVVIKMDTTVGFLADRQQIIDLTRAPRAPHAAYVWRRVFLRGRGHRA